MIITFNYNYYFIEEINILINRLPTHIMKGKDRLYENIFNIIE